jgi:hypothetical protein
MTLALAEAVFRLPAKLTATECAVLVQLALMAGEDGCCWPRQQTVAARARLHPDTVKTTLRALHAKNLIRKEQRLRDDGSEASSMIVMCFEAADLSPGKSGVTPPTRGSSAPTPPGVHDPGAPGANGPPHESSPESRLPPKPPKGGVPGDIVELAAAVWAEAPRASRQRSGTADLERALNAAVHDRGGEPASILAALRSYWADVGARDGGQHLKGVHRMVQQDRWREWIPEDDEPGPARAAGPPISAEAKAEIIERAWRGRLEDFTRIGKWNHGVFGPKPGELGCVVPPALLAEFGLGA